MSGITIKSSSEISSMRNAGEILKDAKKTLSNIVEPGITTIELDKIAERTIRKLGGIPGFKGLYVLLLMKKLFMEFLLIE